MLDQAELILVGDRPDPGHGQFLGAIVSDRLALLSSLAEQGASVARLGSSAARSASRPLGLVVVVLAVDRALELADPFAEALPSSGRRFGPKTTKAMIRTIASSKWSDVWHSTHGNGR